MDLYGVESRKEKKIPQKVETERCQELSSQNSEGSVRAAGKPGRLVRDSRVSGDGLSYGRRRMIALRKEGKTGKRN